MSIEAVYEYHKETDDLTRAAAFLELYGQNVEREYNGSMFEQRLASVIAENGLLLSIALSKNDFSQPFAKAPDFAVFVGHTNTDRVDITDGILIPQVPLYRVALPRCQIAFCLPDLESRHLVAVPDSSDGLYAEEQVTHQLILDQDTPGWKLQAFSDEETVQVRDLKAYINSRKAQGVLT